MLLAYADVGQGAQQIARRGAPDTGSHVAAWEFPEQNEHVGAGLILAEPGTTPHASTTQLEHGPTKQDRALEIGLGRLRYLDASAKIGARIFRARIFLQ